MRHHDVPVSKDCVNEDAMGEICVKCNRCGRYPSLTDGARELTKSYSQGSYLQLALIAVKRANNRGTNRMTKRDFQEAIRETHLVS